MKLGSNLDSLVNTTDVFKLNKGKANTNVLYITR